MGLLERVGVGEEAASPVSSLPTGSARLVELARALSTDPKVLLLDEPCSGLDERETAALGRLLTSLAAEGRAIVLVEHDTDLVLRVCGTVHVLDFGEVIATGPPKRSDRNPAVQEAYLGHAEDARRRRRTPRCTERRGLTVEGVHAAYGRIEVLHGVDLQRSRGQRLRAARAQRGRQEHAAQDHERPPAARPRGQ